MTGALQHGDQTRESFKTLHNKHVTLWGGLNIWDLSVRALSSGLGIPINIPSPSIPHPLLSRAVEPKYSWGVGYFHLPCQYMVTSLLIDSVPGCVQCDQSGGILLLAEGWVLCSVSVGSWEDSSGTSASGAAVF